MKKLYLSFKSLFFVLFCTAGLIQGMETPPNKSIITVEMNDVENDLINTEWTEVIKGIIINVQKVYHPNITFQTIKQFIEQCKDMLARDELSIAQINESLKNNFGIGHLFIEREKVDYSHMNRFIPNYPNNTVFRQEISGSDQKRIRHFYNPSQISEKELETYMDSRKKVSLKLFPSKNGDIPLVKVPSLSVYDTKALLDLFTKMTNLIGRKYNYIILDLRENKGGDIGLTYYFLSLFLGNNDPDIYPILLTDSNKPSYEELENDLKNKPLAPFYDITSFGITVTKNKSEDITFKKLIVLVDKKTFSSGEFIAATLKNTLGSKVCILGNPCAGSFEQIGKPVKLAHDFKLHLPATEMVFYSKKYQKLLTGCRLLPDIRHENMDTIIDKALHIINDSTAFSANPSYERTIGSQSQND